LPNNVTLSCDFPNSGLRSRAVSAVAWWCCRLPIAAQTVDCSASLSLPHLVAAQRFYDFEAVLVPDKPSTFTVIHAFGQSSPFVLNFLVDFLRKSSISESKTQKFRPSWVGRSLTFRPLHFIGIAFNLMWSCPYSLTSCLGQLPGLSLTLCFSGTSPQFRGEFVKLPSVGHDAVLLNAVILGWA
jgi:hypothetical protein